jgi:hypothetical protein
MCWLLKLPDLLQGPSAPIIRVVERDFYSHLGAKLTAEDFMTNCRVIKLLKENGTSTAAQQKWRIFPKAAMDGGMEGLKKYLSAEQYQLALDWIQMVFERACPIGDFDGRLPRVWIASASCTFRNQRVR